MPIRNSQKEISFVNGIQSKNTMQDFLSSHDHIEAYLQNILLDCFNMNPQYGRADYRRDSETLSRRFSHEGLSFATKTMPQLFNNLLRYLETGISDYPGFRKRGTEYPVFLRQLFGPIYENPLSDNAVICMKCLYQLCVAFKKLKGPYKQGVLVKQLDDFVSTDRELGNLSLEDMDMAILTKALHLITQVLEGVDPFDPAQSERFLPRPGPGATNKPTKPHERFRPHVMYTQLQSAFDYAEWFSCLPSYYNGSKATLIGNGRDEIDTLLANIQLATCVTSRFKFVHKEFGKARGICIENLEMQWLQQGIRNALYTVIENHPLTKGYVSFTDQSINAGLALLASRVDSGYDLATIDMKEASNRIWRKLVEFLFSGNQNLLKALLTLSTRVIDMPNDVPYEAKFILANMYAPMGSALCFPVMGLVHFALVKSIISMVSPQHINDIPVWVYGDDIILPKIYAQEVFDKLPVYGMKLNRDKSFVNSNFRESCGENAYNGISITPVRFKSIVHNPLLISDVVTALENEYRLRKGGYLQTAAYIRRELLSQRDLRADALPTVGPKSSVLGWIRDQDDATVYKSFKHLKRRWNSRYQRYEYKARVIVEKLDDSPPVLDCEYYLRKQVVSPKLSARAISGCPLGPRVRWKWLPDSAFDRLTYR